MTAGAGTAPGAVQQDADLERARRAAGAVPDPEVPVLSIDDLGVLRSVERRSDGLVVTITPTYSGCPAMGVIRRDVVEALAGEGFTDVEVVTVLAPAWTTAWMSEQGRAKLTEYGIAPPTGGAAVPGRRSSVVPVALSVRCPRCASPRTRELSRFGSTACKSLWVCSDCAEPFDHFKDH